MSCGRLFVQLANLSKHKERLIDLNRFFEGDSGCTCLADSAEITNERPSVEHIREKEIEKEREGGDRVCIKANATQH